MIHKQKILLLSTIVIATCFPANSWAKGRAVDKTVLENFYLKSGSQNALYNNAAQSSDKVAIGYRPLSSNGMLANARFEQELSYSEPTSGWNNITTARFMSNLVYDLGSTASFKPYIGMGAGFVHNEIQNTNNFTSNSDATSDTLKTYRVMTGFSYEPQNHPAVTVSFGYSFAATDGTLSVKNNLTSPQEYDPNGHTLAAYVSFKF
jgi:opacity protein-like surface antigen